MSESRPCHDTKTSSPSWRRVLNWRFLVRVVLAGACAALFVATVRAGDLSRGWSLIVQAPGLWVVVLPPLLGALADAAAWQQIFLAIGVRLPLGALVATRLSADGVARSLPSGVVFGEATALGLLTGRSGVSAETSLVSLASRKLFATFAHGLTVALSGLFGFAFLRGSSRLLLGRPGLEWFPLLAALGLVAAAVLSPRLALQGYVVKRFPLFTARLRQAGTPAERPFSLRTFLFLGMWLTEAAESFLILRALGSHLSFVQVFAFDVILSLVRSFALFAPAGLGVQDVGYLTILRALGSGPEAAGIATAFVLVKRAREVLFVLAGYLLLFLRAPQEGPSAAAERPLSVWSAS